MELLLTVVMVFVILLISELWWRKQRKPNEFSRKFVHIIVGAYIAFAPFYLRWNEIRLLSLAFLLVVFVSRYRHIFGAVHSVKRKTWGEFCFAIAVGATTFVTQDKWVYMTALLCMSIADGLAAVIGVSYGKTSRYKVLGQTKSIAGTSTFFVSAIAILFAYSLTTPDVSFRIVFVGIALVATALENLSPWGLDNLLVPIAVACLLRGF